MYDLDPFRYHGTDSTEHNSRNHFATPEMTDTHEKIEPKKDSKFKLFLVYLPVLAILINILLKFL